MNVLSKAMKSIIVSAAVLLSAGCAAPERAVINDISDLNGKTVGTMLGWESDYVLSRCTDLDIEIMRYDRLSDMVMALNYNKIDCAALDSVTFKSVKAMTSGIHELDLPVRECGYILAFSSENMELRDDFNSFLADYSESEEYADYMRRIEAFDGIDYQDPHISSNGKGRIIKAAYDDADFPRAFSDPSSGEIKGFDSEALKLWANDRDYKLEYTSSSYEDMLVGLNNGRFDVAFGYLSDCVCWRYGESRNTYEQCV